MSCSPCELGSVDTEPGSIPGLLVVALTRNAIRILRTPSQHEIPVQSLYVSARPRGDQVEAEDLLVSVVSARSNDPRPRDDAAAFSHLRGQGIDPRRRCGDQRRGGRLPNAATTSSRDLASLRPGTLRSSRPPGTDHVVDAPGEDPFDVALGDHGDSARWPGVEARSASRGSSYRSGAWGWEGRWRRPSFPSD